eukprot:scaffold61921_cov69-Phaeocystis_antarctica.AAC.2
MRRFGQRWAGEGAAHPAQGRTSVPARLRRADGTLPRLAAGHARPRDRDGHGRRGAHAHRCPPQLGVRRALRAAALRAALVGAHGARHR